MIIPRLIGVISFAIDMRKFLGIEAAIGFQRLAQIIIIIVYSLRNGSGIVP